MGHDLSSVVNDCGQIDMLVLDFAKAFDTVAHERLLAKVESYGITNGLQNWIRSFLEGRTQRVVVDGETSNAAAVKSVVPQGSILEPLLFLIFINDLAEHLSSTVRLFADDCVMYRQIANVHDCGLLQDDLNQLNKWEERWQLKFNKANCNIMRATHARQKKIVFGYELDGVLLKDTDSTSYLGVELSADMKWNSHVKKVTAKRNTMLGILRRSLKNCPKNLKDLAYKYILTPKLEYTCSIWSSYMAGNIKTLEGVQRRSAHFVCNKFSYHESITSMLKELDWPSLQQRRAEKRMALFHRVVNETVDVDASALLTKSRRSSRKLIRVQYKTHSSKKDCYKYSFVPKSIIQ